MVHDANFVGDRLRLASFLRVVEKGIPQRPSRFQRHLQDVVDQPHACTSAFSGCTNPEASVLDKNIVSSTSNVAASNPSSLSIKVAKVGAAKGTDALQADANRTPESVVHEQHVYDIPRPPTLAELGLSRIFNYTGQDAYSSQSSPQPHEQSRKEAENTRSHSTKKMSGATQKSSIPRKRCLPVHELALLRTTTSAGLPEPSDANIIFAAVVTDDDPVEDSQAKSSLMFGKSVTRVCIAQPGGLQSIDSSQRLGKKVLSTHRNGPSPLTAQEPRENHATSARQMKSSTYRYRRLPAPSNGKQPPQLGFQSGCDGFDGFELGLNLKKRYHRRGKAAPVERKLALVGRLALASGVLPVPTLERIKAPASMERSDSPKLDHTCRASVPERSQEVARLGQFSVARNQGRVEDEQHKAICNQLSSITAPARRVSESSESEPPTEESSSSEDDSDANNNVNNGSRSLSVSRAPNLMDDTSYFERAMYHLDVADLAQSIDEVFLSQNNTLE